VTNKGSFTIEFLAEDSPLTVDNFFSLRAGYFNGQTIPRVVPNFVVQAGIRAAIKTAGRVTRFAAKSTKWLSSAPRSAWLCQAKIRAARNGS